MPAVSDGDGIVTAKKSRLCSIAARNGGVLPLILLVLILGLGFGLRLNAALNRVEHPGVDSRTYESLSVHLYEQGEYGTPRMSSPTDWSPGAPLFFTGVYYLVGSADTTAAMIAVAILGIPLILLTYLLARRLAGALFDRFGQTVAGLVAALLAGIYPTFIDNTGQFLSEPIAALTVVAAVLAFLKAQDGGSVWRWLWPGLLVGITILTRPEYMFVTAALAVLAFVYSVGRRGVVMAVASALIFAVAAALPVAPWTYRNYQQLHRFVPVTSGGGKVLFVATYLPGKGRQVPTKQKLLQKYPDLRQQRFRDIPEVTIEEAEKTLMAPLLDRVASKYLRMERNAALGRIGRENLRKYLRENPLGYLKMTAEKSWNMWYRGSSPAMAAPGWVVFQIVILALALIGTVLLLMLGEYRNLGVIVAVIVCITAVGSLLLGVPRRNVTLMPLVFALAAMGLAWLPAAVRGRLEMGKPVSA